MWFSSLLAMWSPQVKRVVHRFAANMELTSADVWFCLTGNMELKHLKLLLADKRLASHLWMGRPVVVCC